MSKRFEWNSEKAVLNAKRHRVSFDEARTVFADPLADRNDVESDVRNVLAEV
jgi:uncharacterized DUF497 family protein